MYRGRQVESSYQKGFVRYGYINGKFFALEKQSLQLGKHAQGSGVSVMTMALAVAPLFLRNYLNCAYIDAIRRKYDE